MSRNDDLIPISDLLYDIPISELLYDVPISELLYDIPISELLYDVPISDLFYDIPISDLFFDDAGPHVVRMGFPPAKPAERKFTPARGQELRALLDKSIVQLGAVSGETRRKTPARVPTAVAIETLLYSGRAALNRAIEIREGIIESGTPPSRETIVELLDLIALATE